MIGSFTANTNCPHGQRPDRVAPVCTLKGCLSTELCNKALLVSDLLFTLARVWAAWTQFCLRDKKSCISLSWIEHKSGTEDRKDSDLLCGFTFYETIFTVFSHLYVSVSSTAWWLCLYMQCLPQLSLAPHSAVLVCPGIPFTWFHTCRTWLYSPLSNQCCMYFPCPLW